MTITQSPTTELDAVNLALEAIGESPVSSLDNADLLESGQAHRLLTSESRAHQAKGWTYNTDIGATLLPQSDGTILLPANILGFLPKAGRKLTYRGGKVYDPLKQTFNIGQSVTADLILFLAFEDIPEAARMFVAIRAARKMQDKHLGDSQLHQFNASDELDAWAEFLHREGEDADYNIVDNSPTMQRMFRYRAR